MLHISPRHWRWSLLLVPVLLAALLSLRTSTYTILMVVAPSRTSYYVAPTGKDTNPGTATQPLATIAKAVSLAQAGDTVLLLPGSYNQRSVISKSGAPDKPITIKSSSSDPGQYAVIDRKMAPGSYGASTSSCVVITDGASWITLENLKFQNCWTDIIRVDNGSYITVRGAQALGGRHVVYASNSSHHLLIENSRWLQDRRVWEEWGQTQTGWKRMHHGDLSYYNGGLFGAPTGGMGGAVVIRNNTISYAFNGIRWWGKAGSKLTSPNIEIYNNRFDYMVDNGVEPEGYAYNLHIYHNVFHNVPKGLLSYDNVQGGDVLFYGNIGWLDSDTLAQNSWTTYKLKAKTDTTTGRLYIYHNSFYYNRPFGRCKNPDTCNPISFLRAYNNAYYHIDKDMGPVSDWSTYGANHRYNYDCSSAPWDSMIIKYRQEQNGLASTDPQFVDPVNGNLRLKASSPCIDKGRVISDFTQNYQGAAPDIGAYEGDKLVEGPPFYDRVPSVGLVYTEKPRITRHRVNGSELHLFFSAALDPATLSAASTQVQVDGSMVPVNSVQMGTSNREVIITVGTLLEGKQVKLKFDTLPKGTNGQAATYWASTIGTIGETNPSVFVKALP